MAANNRGNMRPAGRSPPFLAIGLFVALVILGFNYWNLSVKNGEQFNEISVMERELKIVAAKKTALEKRAEAIQDKVKYLEDELNKQKGYVAEKASALATAQNERESVAQAKDEMQTEFNLLKEKVPLCQKEVADLKSELEALKAELEQKKAETPQTVTCGESECARYIAMSRDGTLTDIMKIAGPSPLMQLYKAGGNVGKFSEQLKSYLANQASPINEQPALQQPAQQQPAQQQPAQQPGQQDPVAVVVGQQQPAQAEQPHVEHPQQPSLELKKPEIPGAGQPAQDNQPLAVINPQPVGDNQVEKANNEQPVEPQAGIPAPVQEEVKPAEQADAAKDQNLAANHTTDKQNMTGLARPLNATTRSSSVHNNSHVIKEPVNKPNEAQIPKPDEKQSPALDDKLEKEDIKLDDADDDADEDADAGAGAGPDPVPDDDEDDYDDDDDAANVPNEAGNLQKEPLDLEGKAQQDYDYDDDKNQPVIDNIDDDGDDYDADDDYSILDKLRIEAGKKAEQDAVAEMKQRMDNAEHF